VVTAAAPEDFERDTEWAGQTYALDAPIQDRRAQLVGDGRKG